MLVVLQIHTPTLLPPENKQRSKNPSLLINLYICYSINGCIYFRMNLNVFETRQKWKGKK